MRRKKVFLRSICLASVLTVLALVPTYTKPAPAPSKVPSKIIELKFSNWSVPKKAVGDIYDQDPQIAMCNEINNRSQGRIHVTFYHSGALGSGMEHLDMVEKGLVDFAYVTTSWFTGRFPLTDILSVPMSYPNYWVAGQISQYVYDRILYKEYTTVKAFHSGGMGQFYINLTKPVKTLEEFKKLRIRDPGGLPTKFLTALGAVPVTMPLPEVYESMQRGVIDGAVMVPYMMKVYRIHEVTKFTLKFPMGCALAENMMNKNSWERLPDDLKPIVEAAGRMAAQLKYIYQDYSEERDMAAVAKAGPVYTLPATEGARWRAAMKPVVDRWVVESEAKGLPAREVVSIFREECAKRGVAWPY